MRSTPMPTINVCSYPILVTHPASIPQTPPDSMGNCRPFPFHHTPSPKPKGYNRSIMTTPNEPYPLDRKHLSVVTLREEGDEKAFWMSATPEQRLEAIETNREIVYGYDPSTERLQRVLEITQLQRG